MVIHLVQFSRSVIPTLCRPMDCSTSGFPVHHQLPEPTQTHVHWVGDAIQPSRPLLSPYPSAFNLSQHQFSSFAQLFFVTPCTAAHQASLSITNSWSLFKLISIESVMPSNHLILLSPSPPAFNLSQHQGLFKWVSSSHQVAKVLEFQLQHPSFQWIFRTDLL